MSWQQKQGMMASHQTKVPGVHLAAVMAGMCVVITQQDHLITNVMIDMNVHQ